MGYPTGADPIVIRVILKENIPTDLVDLRNSYEKYPIVYEVRRPNRAVVGLWERFTGAVGKIAVRDTEKPPSIGRANPNTAGTLGGLLGGVDPRKMFIVTCAHVLGPSGTTVYRPGPYEGKDSQPVGIVRYYDFPLPGTNADPCGMEATPNASRLDLAVAEVNLAQLSEFSVVKLVNGIRPIKLIRKNDLVSFTGKTRGPVEAKVGALTLWDQIEFPDGVRCFGRIFELKSRTREYIREDLAHPGDSGSWVIFDDGELTTWYGMVISCDGGQAYACFSAYILEACNRSTVFPGGLKLLV
jgi:hypothetical protein